MEIQILKPRKALNKAFLKVKPVRTDIERFKANLSQLFDGMNDSESEEFHKNLVADFLKNTYYKQKHFINTKARNDLVIHNGEKATSTVGVIIEAKKPANKAEMLTKDKINVKAFQELVLYYLRERISQKNIEIKHLIATNIYEWFIFDATVFDRSFAQNKNLVSQFTEFEGERLADIKTDFFYKQIAEPFIDSIKQEIEFAYFDIRDYEKPLRNDNNKDDNQLIVLFKLFSPEHLLKLPFANDSNTLDKRFYSELLHIIGLTEIKEGSKKLIGRNKEGQRNPGSLLENAMIQLESLDKLSRIEKSHQVGNNKDEILFNLGLELSITWINRILFLKLLEAQLISYHKDDKSFEFLNFNRIHNYDALNKLFFQVLAKKHSERSDLVQKTFDKVPFLNSSLFEPTNIEHQTIFISNLEDDYKIPVYSSTFLKDQKSNKLTGELNPLQYLFEFLNAYDFASEGSEEIQEDNKTLINASVLGLIFEKINGYKDGSFFTPGFITMFMCRQTIRKAIIQKFNDKKGWNCTDLNSLYDKIEDRTEANNIINDLKICDIAVGSGHFLVSALNEIIAVKNDLKILSDREGRRLKEYHFEVVNDDLIVTDENGELFEYNPKNRESQRVQEALFHEKQTIIENCLFGVDINPNSVKICRLRLWIELLKNSYYQVVETHGRASLPPESPLEGGRGVLQTLPNIDINIKCGNSLISRFALDADLKQVLRKSKWTMDSYRVAVATYREAKNKGVKREMERLILLIKQDFTSEIRKNDPLKTRLDKMAYELYNRFTGSFLFEPEVQYGKPEKEQEKKRKREQEKLEKEIQSLNQKIEEIKDNKIFENSFEWRFEFPEVLDDNGDFVGFDVIIGNPPYGIKANEAEQNLFRDFYQANDDIYTRFMEKGLDLLHDSGHLIFITPIFWLNGQNFLATRKMLKERATLTEGVILPYDIFHEAYIDTGIFHLTKGKSNSPAKVLEFGLHESISFIKLINSRFHWLKPTDWQNNDNLAIVMNPFWRNIKDKVYLALSIGLISDSFRGLLANRDDYSNQKENDDFVPVFTDSFNRYETLSGTPDFVNYSKIKEGPKNFNSFNGKKVLVRRIVNRQLRIMATISDSLMAFKKDVYLFFPYEPGLTEFLVGILNSKLISFILTLGSTSARKDDFTQITLNDIRKIGIPPYTEKDVRLLTEKVTSILTIKKADIDADRLEIEAEIDHHVYQLYNLTPEEVEIIEKSVR